MKTHFSSIQTFVDVNVAVGAPVEDGAAAVVARGVRVAGSAIVTRVVHTVVGHGAVSPCEVMEHLKCMS